MHLLHAPDESYAESLMNASSLFISSQTTYRPRVNALELGHLQAARHNFDLLYFLKPRLLCRYYDSSVDI